jgi:hypothetical protein
MPLTVSLFFILLLSKTIPALLNSQGSVFMLLYALSLEMPHV